MPLLEEHSGLCWSGRPGAEDREGFYVGYSPERINPGDKEHRLETIVKVVSGDNAETLDRVAALYGEVVQAGVHKAASVKVAEAAKVIGEHAARPQHRAHERTGFDLQSTGY